MKTFLPPTLIVFLSLRENVKRKKNTKKSFVQPHSQTGN